MADSRLAHGPTLHAGGNIDDPPVGTPAGRADGADDLASGTQVGEYIVERFLGAGAMGEVYAGVHPVIGKKVAIKVLKRSVAESRDGAERFKREARAVNQVDHPNVVDVFSFGRLDDGRLYLVMDLVAGRSLRAAVTAGPLPVAMALDVLAQIADALDAAHAKGVVHRDLKPDNVMLAGDPASTTPNVFVLDFGLAKLLAQPGPDGELVAQASMLTGQGTWLGTPSYMAPEQWSADGAGPASDRYALGVMAFELLAGSVPFEARNLPQMMEQHFRAVVPTLTARGAVASSAKFDPVVTRAMAKDPGARFATARAMVDALRAIAGPAAPRAATTAKRYVPAMLGLGVLGLAIGAMLSLRRDEPRPTPPKPAIAVPGLTPGKVRIHFDSIPRGAELHHGNLSAKTPMYLDADQGERVVVELRKPGYLPMQRSVTAAAGMKLAPFLLLAIEGFQGIWLLPSGELRSFRRVGDRVEVSKLAAVDAEPVFFRAYDLVPSTSGVTFSTTETIRQPDKPDRPSCYLPYTTEYHYDPSSDELTVRRAKISIEVVNSACIATSGMTDPETLARADRHRGEAVETLAPVGIVKRAQSSPARTKLAKRPPENLDKLRTSRAKDSLAPKLAPNALDAPLPPPQAKQQKRAGDVQPRPDPQQAPPTSKPTRTAD